MAESEIKLHQRISPDGHWNQLFKPGKCASYPYPAKDFLEAHAAEPFSDTRHNILNSLPCVRVRDLPQSVVGTCLVKRVDDVRRTYELSAV